MLPHLTEPDKVFLLEINSNDIGLLETLTAVFTFIYDNFHQMVAVRFHTRMLHQTYGESETLES